MKRIFVPILTAAVLAVGCNKTNEVADPAANPETRSGAVQEPLTFSDATLSFVSMEEMNAAAREAVSISAEEREQMYAANPEFVSMEKAGGMIIEQMREIGTKEGILAMRDAYTDLFIFDPNTVEVRVAPLFKASQLGHQHVCNAYGDVTIGGTVVNLNDINTFEQSWVGEGQKEMLADRAGEPRATTSFELYSNTRNHRLTVAAKYNSNPYGAVPFIRLKSETGYNGMWFPNTDTYTVSYVIALTDNSYVSEYDTRYEFSRLTGSGTSFTRNTPSTSYQEDITVGQFMYPYFRTGYNIASKWAGKNADLLMKN